MINMIKKTIQSSKKGSLSYSDYIDFVLYNPQYGYYMKDHQKIGKKGDFYTNSNVHSVFGKVLSNVFHHLISNHRFPPFICEIGAGTGRLANAILQELKKRNPKTFEDVQYYIVEISPYHRKEQQKNITDIDKVHQFISVEDMLQKQGEFSGIVLSNELFDAFPVDVVRQKGDTLYEVRVTLEGDQLVEVETPCEKQEIFDWLNKNEICLADGQRMEIPLEMERWLEATTTWFKKGVMFTIDYGYRKEEWMDPVHRDGSLRGFYKHQMISNPLLYPGEMDITTHIHFDALIKKGGEVGLHCISMLRQQQFLIKGGILEYLQETDGFHPFSEVSKQNRAIRSFVLDDGISSSFTVLIQSKGVKELKQEEVLPYELS